MTTALAPALHAVLRSLFDNLRRAHSDSNVRAIVVTVRAGFGVSSQTLLCLHCKGCTPAPPHHCIHCNRTHAGGK